MTKAADCTHQLGRCEHCSNCIVCEFHSPDCSEYAKSPAAAALKKAFPEAIFWPDCDDETVTAAFGRVMGTQLFRFHLKRPWALAKNDCQKYQKPKKPWPDVWEPTLFVGSGCGYSPGGVNEQELTLVQSVTWLRQKVDEVIWSLGRASR